MTDKKKNGWIKFVPSLDLPKERVSIAYDTHDERGVRYTYGYFQFYNGTCGCFLKDGNEQPKVVKAEDIKYWMPVPSLDMQEDPVSEDLEEAAREYTEKGSKCQEEVDSFIAGANWQKEQMMKEAIEGIARPDDSEIWCNLASFNLKDGDKVKVIVKSE